VTSADDARLREMYNRKYREERWSPMVLRPDAFSTGRQDDAARLLRGERGRLLELGCGSGQFLIAIAPQFERVVGMDISDLRIQAARAGLLSHAKALAPRVEFIAGRADQRLPFEDGSFDTIVSTVALEFVPDIFTACDEMARVCRRGGCAVITVANVCYIRHVWSLVTGRIPVTGSPSRDMAYWREHGWDGGTLRYFSRRTLSDLLRHVGFEPEAWSGAGGWARVRRLIPNLCGTISVRARRR